MLITIALLYVSCNQNNTEEQINNSVISESVDYPVINVDYPVTKKIDSNTTYFDTVIVDPYRWLEDQEAADVADWAKREEQTTQNYLAHIPFRDAIVKRLHELLDYERMGAPFKNGGVTFYYKNDGKQDQFVLYRMNEGKDDEVFLDPNKLSDDGTVALSGFQVSKDTAYAVYAISRTGSDWEEIYVKNVKTGKDLPDHVMWAKFTDISWFGNGFFLWKI